MKKLAAAACGVALIAASNIASAHTVSLSWDVLNNGDVTFYDQHWHGSLAGPAGSLFIDGTEHAFTGILNNTGSITGLEGALVNPSYATFVGGTLTALSEPNFLTVTVSGLLPGQHTFATTNIALTQWTIPGSGGSINVVLPPPPNPDPTVPEPGTLALMALGLAGLGFRKRLVR